MNRIITVQGHFNKSLYDEEPSNVVGVVQCFVHARVVHATDKIYIHVRYSMLAREGLMGVGDIQPLLC